MAGPTAENIEDKEGIDTTGEGIAKLSKMAKLSAENIPLNGYYVFSQGCVQQKGGDFVLGEVSDAMGFLMRPNSVPGLSSALAIGEYLADSIAEAKAEKKEEFNPRRKDIPCVAEMGERN